MHYTTAQALAARRDFPALAATHGGPMRTYLDGPGGTQVPQCVIDAVSHCYRECNVNVGGAFETSHAAADTVLVARTAVADFLGAAGPSQISFGANMTTLSFALARALGRALAPDDEIIITALDHEANRGPWLSLAAQGIVIREARLLPDGVLDLAHLASLVSARTRIMAVGLASNALGTVTPFAPIRLLAREVNALTVVDAVHYAAHFPVDFNALDCDFLLCSAYKFYGPHVGILCARHGLLETLDTDRLRTQTQTAPHRIETGTPNFAALAGVSAAIDYLATQGAGPTRRAQLVDAMQGIAEYEHMLAGAYWQGLDALPGIVRHGPGMDATARAPTVSFACRTPTVDRLAAELATQGLQVWHGHFYAPRVIETLGLVDQGGLLRVGFSLYNTPEELGRLLTALREYLMRAAAGPSL